MIEPRFQFIPLFSNAHRFSLPLLRIQKTLSLTIDPLVAQPGDFIWLEKESGIVPAFAAPGLANIGLARAAYALSSQDEHHVYCRETDDVGGVSELR